MAYNVERINKEKLYEIYTPSGANKDGFTDRDEFESVVGTTDFHSFQVWRATDGSKATCTYALTLKQVQAIVNARNRQMGGLKSQITKLRREVTELRGLRTVLEAAAVDNYELKRALNDATVEAARAIKMNAALQFNLDTLAQSVPDVDPRGAERSLMGKSAAQLVVEAQGRTDRIRSIVSVPMGGAPLRADQPFVVNRYDRKQR